MIEIGDIVTWNDNGYRTDLLRQTGTVMKIYDDTKHLFVISWHGLTVARRGYFTPTVYVPMHEQCYSEWLKLHDKAF